MIDRVLASRSLVFSIFALVLVIAGIGASSLSIDPNNRVFFGSAHEHFRNLESLEARFGSNTNLFFVIASDEDLFSSPQLSDALRWLANEAWRIDQVVSVDSIATYPHVTDDGEEMVVFNLLDYVCPVEGCVEERADALLKPYLIGRYLDRQFKTLSVVAKIDLTSVSSESVLDVSSKAEALTKEFQEEFGDVSIYLTGGVPMMNAFFTAAQSDSETLLVLVVVLLCVGLYLFLGGWFPTLLMLGLGVSAVLVTLGIAGWAGLVINTATATLPLVVFTLVVASAMHVFLHIVREERLDSTDAVLRAVRTSVASNWRPVALTAATTAVGLLSMLFVSAPPLRQLGVLAAIGVLVGALFSLSVVPCAFSLLSKLRTSNYLMRIQASLNGYAKWFEETRPRMIWVFLLFVSSLFGLVRIDFDEDFVRYFATDTPFREDTEKISELLAGPYHMDIVYDSGESAGVYSEQSITHVRDLVSYMRSRGEVVNVASLIDVLAEVSRAISGQERLSGRSAEELAQYFLTYELSLGIGQSTKDFLDSDHRRTRISVLLDDVSMSAIRDLVEDARRWAESAGIEQKITVTGEGVPTAYLSSESIREMGVGIFLSVMLSALCVGFYFGSVKACVSILAATGVPILAGFGVWGWVESDIGMAATLVVATTIGVVIDDTIHLTYRYVDSLRHLDLTPWGATAYSIHKTGTAIFVTSAVLVAGLLVLLVSDFRMNSTFGACSSLVIALALLYNLTIAPRLLSQLR